MQDPARVSMLIVQTVLQAAQRSGLDADDLLRHAGIDPERAQDPTEPIPVTQEEALWRLVHAKSGDEAFGLRAATGLERGAFRGLEYAVRASATVGEALRVLERFGRLLHGERMYELREDPDGTASLSYDAVAESTDPLIADFALASAVALLRDATGVDWTPKRVTFRHREPSDVGLYRRFFRSNLEFEQKENAIEFDAQVLATPMREADATLRSVLEQYLTAELQSLDPIRSLEDSVRTTIMRSLPDQESDLDTIAAKVGLSPRVLQKRLQQSGTSFQEVLDHVREGLAKRYLLQPTVSLSGTALLLGYSDVTAFHRAFKRWTGLTPGDYRRRALRDGHGNGSVELESSAGADGSGV